MMSETSGLRSRNRIAKSYLLYTKAHIGRISHLNMTKTNTKNRPKLPYKILCVDDEDSILHALHYLFNYLGYQVIVARSGEEALSILESHLDLNVIISDERFKPDQMKGSQFLKQSRELCPDAVRILLTAFSDAAELEKAVNEAEIFRGVSKPWNNKALALIVKEGVMRQQGARKQQKQTEMLTKRSQHFRQVSQELAKTVGKQEEEIEQLLESRSFVLSLDGGKCNRGYKPQENCFIKIH